MDLFCPACFFPRFLATFVQALGFALYAVLMARVLLSWVQVPLPAGLQRWLFDVTEPILAPIRRALPGQGGLDLSPLIAFILIGLVQQALLTLLARLMYG